MSSGLLDLLFGLGVAVGPGGGLVVEGAMIEAAVEDADEPVREGSLTLGGGDRRRRGVRRRTLGSPGFV